VTGEPAPPLEIEGLDPDERSAITKSARHYGFHATLKAPFELAAGKDADELYKHARSFAAARKSFEAPTPRITPISRWIAFTLSGSCPAMDQLAADCVRDFEAFRAPLSDADIERRRKSGLSDRQDAHLLAFGYPLIFEDFHFHMTLAGPLEEARRNEIAGLLQAKAPALDDQPLIVDAIAIYEQENRDLPFIQIARLPFGERRSS
jgi:2'-5' RNA ligase